MKLLVVLFLQIAAISCFHVSKRLLAPKSSSRTYLGSSATRFQVGCKLAIQFGSDNQPELLKKLLTKHKGEPSEFYILTHHAYINVCRGGHVESLKMLVEDLGLPPSYFNAIGMTSAIRYGQENVIKYLVDKGMLDDRGDLLMGITMATKSGQDNIRTLLEEKYRNQMSKE